VNIQTASARTGSILLIIVAVAIAACSASGPGSSPIAGPGEAAGRTPEPSPSFVPSPEPTPEPTVAPTPRPPLPVAQANKATWSKPNLVMHGNCPRSVAVIDDSSRYHVAGECDMKIRYATSTNGKTWETTTFKAPAHRFDVDPQIAIDGRTLYLAFTRLRPTDGGCGDDGLVDVGVFYRTRALPSGKWSTPVQIGKPGDHLQSFRVVNGVIHETVNTHEEQGPVYYASQRGATHRRVLLKDAQQTSLRIGDDRRARVAFTTDHTVRLATIGSAGRVNTHTVFAANDVYTWSPVLVLGANNAAYLSWTATTWSGGGCADGDFQSPREGTWFATDASGRWERKRLTPDPTFASLAADAETGRVHVLYADSRGYRFITRAADGTWSGIRLDRSIDAGGLLLRRDAATGRFLAVGTQWTEDEARNGIYALVRR
jgi:hypothetical protein